MGIIKTIKLVKVQDMAVMKMLLFCCCYLMLIHGELLSEDKEDVRIKQKTLSREKLIISSVHVERMGVEKEILVEKETMVVKETIVVKETMMVKEGSRATLTCSSTAAWFFCAWSWGEERACLLQEGGMGEVRRVEDTGSSHQTLTPTPKAPDVFG